MIDGVPEPPGRFIVADAAPHLVEFCLDGHWLPPSCLRSDQRLEPLPVDLWEACGLFLSVLTTVAELTPSTRTTSRTPQPLSVRSTMRCLIAGKRPVSWYCKRKMRRGQSGSLHR